MLTEIELATLDMPRIKLLPKQKQFIFDNYSLFLGYGGGIGSGKTLAAIIKVLLRIQNPETGHLERILIARKDYPKLIDSIETELFDRWPQIKSWFCKEESIITFPNGAQIYIRHATDVQDFKGPTYTAAYLDQIEEFTENMFFHIFGRLRPVGRNTKIQLWFTFNPNGHDWLYRVFKKNQDLRDAGKRGADFKMKIIETTTYDNKYLPQEFLDGLTVMKREQPTLYRRLVMGSWEAAAGLVYEEFGNGHVYDPDLLEIPLGGTRLRGTDYGGTNQNFTVWVYVDNDFNHFVYREHVKAGSTVMQNSSDIIKLGQVFDPGIGIWKEEEYYGSFLDPSAFSLTREHDGERCSIAKEFADYGLEYQPGTRDKQGGIAHLRNLIHVDDNHINPFTGKKCSPRLFISKDCPVLIEQLRNLKYEQIPDRQIGNRNLSEKVHKHDDHGPDSLMMACSTNPFPILKEGERFNKSSYAYEFLRARGVKDLEEFDPDEFYGGSDFYIAHQRC